jgi:hypothetical protein
MNPANQHPIAVDLSFEFENKKVVFTISQFEDRDIIVLSDIEKIVYVSEIFFPRIASEYFNRQLEYDTKLLFGCESVSDKEFIKKFSIFTDFWFKNFSLLFWPKKFYLFLSLNIDFSYF